MRGEGSRSKSARRGALENPSERVRARIELLSKATEWGKKGGKREASSRPRRAGDQLEKPWSRPSSRTTVTPTKREGYTRARTIATSLPETKPQRTISLAKVLESLLKAKPRHSRLRERLVAYDHRLVPSVRQSTFSALPLAIAR